MGTQFPPRPIFLALLLILSLFSFLALMPLLILFVSKDGETTHLTGMHCATCKQLSVENENLGRERGCYVKGSHVVGKGIYMPPLAVGVEVPLEEPLDAMERCWVVELGMDVWGRPEANAGSLT